MIAFNDFHRKSLENRTNDLAQKNETQDKMLAEKNRQVLLLFTELATIRKMLNESLAARNTLEKAYLNLDTKFQLTQQNFINQNKSLSEKIITAEVQRQASLAGESKATQQVALLGQALKENEVFYTKDVNKLFDDLAYELETTRSQLALATDACLETEHEVAMLKQQLEMTQKLLSKQGFSPKNERDLKNLQMAINKVGKQATSGSTSYHKQLSEALTHIQKLDSKLEKTQLDLAKNEVALKNKTAAEAKSNDDIKMLSSEISKLKREYQSNLAHNNLQSAQTLRTLNEELNTAKHGLQRATKSLAAKDQAFEVLEKHCKTLQATLTKETEAQKKLVAQLNTQETNLKTAHAKLAHAEAAEHTLRNLTKKAQDELKEEMATTHQLAGQLKSVSSKLASAEMIKEKAVESFKDVSSINNDLSFKLRESERQVFALKNDRDFYMSERNQFSLAASRVAEERNMFADRLNSVLKTVSHATHNAQRGITPSHPHGVAIA